MDQFIFLITVQFTYPLRIRYQHSPPLIWRDVGESKHRSESFKLFTSKHFGEDVCICSLVAQWRRWIVLASTWCQIKWCLVLMCFVRSWNVGFLANFIAEVLSIMSGVEFTCFTCKSSRIFLSHTISFVASTAATYSASVGTDCLRELLIQES